MDYYSSLDSNVGSHVDTVHLLDEIRQLRRGK